MENNFSEVLSNDVIQNEKTHKTLNLQDVFLNQVRKERMPIIIFLTNGFQLKGVVKGFDNYVIIIEIEGKMNMVYKHAISTMVPSKNVNILANPPTDK